MYPKLDNLIRYLTRLTHRADLKELERLLTETGVRPGDIESACVFDEVHYARNKIASGPWFDLYVMCWRSGQSSAIHDHAGSSCAFKILQGVSTEVAFELSDVSRRIAVKRGVRRYAAGEICCAQDEQIHQIVNASETNDLITLHIYSPPLNMNVYQDGDSGKEPSFPPAG